MTEYITPKRPGGQGWACPFGLGVKLVIQLTYKSDGQKTCWLLLDFLLLTRSPCRDAILSGDKISQLVMAFENHFIAKRWSSMSNKQN